MDTWGLETIIDLKDCDHNVITNVSTITRFLKDLTAILDMEPYEEPIIKRFGKEDKYGYTAIQLIQTSNITAHFDEQNNSAYINVFSCKSYEPVDAVDFAVHTFKASSNDYMVLPRGNSFNM